MKEAFPPLIYEWLDTGCFMPLIHLRKEADREFVVGYRYMMKVVEERSERSHGFYMAAIGEIWKNLPETIAGDFPTPDSLRYHALIRTGYFTKRTYVARDADDARAVAAFAKPSAEKYCIVTITGPVVDIYEPESQNQSPEPIGMGRERFEASKTATLAWIEDFLGWEPGTITPKTGKKAAAAAVAAAKAKKEATK